MFKQFFFKLFSSINQLNFYRELKTEKLKSSFLFFFFWFLAFGFWLSAEINFRQIPKLQDNLAQELNNLPSNYPADLVINWSAEKLSLNQSELVIDYPEFMRANLNNQVAHKLAILSAQQVNEISPLENLSTQALIVIDPDQIFVSNLRDNWNHMQLKELPGFETDFELNKDSLPQFITSWQEMLKKDARASKILVFILAPILLVGWRLITVLIDSCLIFLLATFFTKFKFRDLLQISLHLSVIAGLIERLSSTMYPQINFPMYGLSFWTLSLFVILRLNQQKHSN